MHAVDVVIAGAGPTGLALACGLASAGVSVLVVDRADGPATTSRALGLQPRGVEVLDRLDALGDLPERSVRIAAVAVSINGTPAARLPVGRPTGLVTRPGLLVSQAEIEASLRRRLGDLGARVDWGCELLDASQDAEGVTMLLGGSGSVRAGWLVGCDGAHSRVRKVAAIAFPGVAVIERFLLADVDAGLPLPHDAASVWLSGDDLFAAFPLPGPDLWRLMATAPRDAAEDVVPEAVLPLVTRLLEERTGQPASVVQGARWTSSFQIHRRLARTYRRGRMLLAGDAAHVHSPLGGQGMNTGLGDAENLAWKLALVATGRAAPALLDTYEAERRPVATDVLESTSAITRLVLGEHAVARVVRDRVFVPLMNRPVVQRLIWEQASQLKVSYRHGPLAPGRRFPAGDRPRPGERVPDLPCRWPDGRQTRLHAELGPAWALVAPPTPAGRACASLLRDRFGTGTLVALEPAEHAGEQALLVRPDAHLGWRGLPVPEILDRWLTGVLKDGHVR